MKLTTAINTYSTIILDKFSTDFHNMVQSLSYEFQVVYHKMDNSLHFAPCFLIHHVHLHSGNSLYYYMRKYFYVAATTNFTTNFTDKIKFYW